MPLKVLRVSVCKAFKDHAKAIGKKVDGDSVRSKFREKLAKLDAVVSVHEKQVKLSRKS